MGKILVTGGAGFIGSHTVLELLENGYDVVCVDNFVNAVKTSEGKAESLCRVEKLTGKKVEFIFADLKDIQQVREIFHKHQFFAIIHFAALKAVGESVAQPMEYYKNNLLGALNLLEAAKEAKVVNFIFSSSATVYGSPEFLPLTEDHPVGIGLTNPYGQTKYFIEQILRDLQKAEPHWNIILLRYFNPVGAHPSGEIGEDPKGVPNNLMPFVAQVAVGKLPQVRVYGNDYDTVDGTGVRDYIHVVDLAKGHLAALDAIKKGATGCAVYNLGTGQGYSVLQMIKALGEAAGKDIPYTIEARREGDIASVYCDPKKAKDELGWSAQLGLTDMCRHLWNWQSKNPNGFNAA